MRHKEAVQKQSVGFKSVQTDRNLTCVESNFEKIVPIPKYDLEDLQKLDEQVKSMMQNSQNMIKEGQQHRLAKICNSCGKEGCTTAIINHIEANHLDRVSLPCNNCENTFRTRHALRRQVVK